MSNIKNMLHNERGGVNIMVLSLIVLIFCVSIMVVSVDYPLMVTQVKLVKNQLNSSVHAASLSINEQRLADGYLELDTTTPGTSAQDMFYKYLRLNLRLDSNNVALASSFLPTGQQVVVHELVYVNYTNGTLQNLKGGSTTCDYSSGAVSCNLVLNAGTPQQITRTINETIIGPSIVAIIQVYHNGIGLLSDEPIVIPSVQEVIFRKK